MLFIQFLYLLFISGSREKIVFPFFVNSRSYCQRISVGQICRLLTFGLFDLTALSIGLTELSESLESSKSLTEQTASNNQEKCREFYLDREPCLKNDTGSVSRGGLYAFFAGILAFCLFFSGGCVVKMTELRTVSNNPLNERFSMTSPFGPVLTDRAAQTLKGYNLSAKSSDRIETLIRLQQLIDQKPTLDLIYAFSETAYLEGARQEKSSTALAAEIYVAAALHAYMYLFDPRFETERNSYASDFRDVCLIYNGSLEKLLRLLTNDPKKINLAPGMRYSVHTAKNSWNVYCTRISGHWNPDEIDSFRFASDYEIRGLKYEYRQQGLGVPLIAQRKKNLDRNQNFCDPGEKYYPPGLCFPVTVFLRPDDNLSLSGFFPVSSASSKERQPGLDIEQSSKPVKIELESRFAPRSSAQIPIHATLELYDPLVSGATSVNNQLVPLETDLTTPLAWFLTNPVVFSLGTVGLIWPDALLKPLPGAKERSFRGLYMIQPYEQGKIPVVLVHGLWSSPMTWMEMFNTLRSIPEIRDKYQFWFYFYPSGQPFWVSAAELRNDLEEIRDAVDSERKESALDNMVLVGHSMGGLICRLQVTESQDEFWKLVSDIPLDDLKLDDKKKENLRQWFFFHPNPSIKRVITIATPHKGSPAANDLTKWFAQRSITLPQKINSVLKDLTALNESALKSHSLLNIETSVGSLSDECPVFEVLLRCQISDDVVFNNIVGVVPNRKYSLFIQGQGDGIVPMMSAHFPLAESEYIVPEEHSKVHDHPMSALEIQRILRFHLTSIKTDSENMKSNRSESKLFESDSNSIFSEPIQSESIYSKPAFSEETPIKYKYSTSKCPELDELNPVNPLFLSTTENFEDRKQKRRENYWGKNDTNKNKKDGKTDGFDYLIIQDKYIDIYDDKNDSNNILH